MRSVHALYPAHRPPPLLTLRLLCSSCCSCLPLSSWMAWPSTCGDVSASTSRCTPRLLPSDSCRDRLLGELLINQSIKLEN